MNEVKYRHPANPELTWSGKGRQPKWVEFMLSEGYSLAELAVDDKTESEIDLGIGGATPVDAAQVLAQAAEIQAPAVVQPAASESAAGRDLVNQLLGQAQAFSAASSLLQTFGVSKLAYVKENSLYKSLAGTRAPNGLELKGTWVEFCGLLGMSDEKANSDIANLRAFGEEALESMSRMGIGYRELRQYRKLPADERLALIEAAKTGDKDQLIDLAETIMVKHAKEKETLEADKAEAEKDLDAERKRANNIEAELEVTQGRLQDALDAKRLTKFDPRTEDIRAESLALQADCELRLNGLRKLFNDTDMDAPEGALQIEHLWLAVNAIAARATDLISHISAYAQSELPERPLGQHVMTQAEAERWIVNYTTIENRYVAEAAARQDKRDAEKPRGRGRPKGSTNKAAE